MKAKIVFRRKVILSIVFIFAVMAVFAFTGTESLYADSTQEAVNDNNSALSWGLVAASIAFGLGALGAGIAIGNVGSAAMGAIGEKPEVASQALIFVALAEGVVVFGFITALLILGKV